MTSREWIKYCIENGLCVSCHKPSDTGKQYCSECAEKVSERNRDRRTFYLNAGICPVCGRNDLVGEERVCAECKAKQIERNQQRDNRNVYSYVKERRKRFKEQGRCVVCGTVLTNRGYTTCPSCREKRRQDYAITKSAHRERRIAKGQCYICGSPDLAEGQKLCVLCYKRQLKNVHKMLTNRKKKE